MEFLGVGPLELVFVFIIIILVLGPEDMVKAGKTMGRFLNQVVKSESWQAIQEISREIRTLPSRLAREANLEEALSDVPVNTISPPETETKPSPQEASPEESIENGIKAWITPPDEKSDSLETEKESAPD